MIGCGCFTALNIVEFSIREYLLYAGIGNNPWKIVGPRT